MIKGAWAAAEREISARRRALVAERDRVRAGAVSRDARVGELEVLIARAIMRRDASLDKLKAEFAERLAAQGLAPGALDSRYSCTLCRDTGRDRESGENCRCLIEEYSRQLLAHSGMQMASEGRFELYDERVFPEEEVRPGLTQRAYMARMRELLESFADSYPNVDRSGAVLTGQSGLGKSFLLSAVAHRVMQRGVQCLCVTAFQMGQAMRDAHMGAASSEFGLLIAVPLLCVDDLGTEPLFENVTINYLFNLLNERQRVGQGTLIATNLTLDELKSRYTERVFSRMCDEKGARIYPFYGRDIRVRGARLQK